MLTQSAAVANKTRCPAWQALIASPIARCVLPVPGGPRNTTLSLATTKSRVPRWATRSRLSPRAWSKSNSSNDFRAGNRAARMRPSPPCDSRAETSRCRHATRTSSWLQDSARARSARRSTDSRSVGALSARVRKATSADRSRTALAAVAGGGGGPSRPTAVEVVEAQCGVVVAQRALLDVEFGDRAQHRDPFAPQRPGCGYVVGIGDRLVPRPESFVVGDDPTVAEHPHPPQVGDLLDTTPDHRRMHRVVIAAQGDVMIASQSCRQAATRYRRHRRQGQHRVAIGNDGIRRGAPQRPALPSVDHRNPLLQLTVEVNRRDEYPTWQKRPLQVVVTAL